ncbi:MAG: hypothetical protein A2271_05080 [Candidatus Moranbacteria bacterium RIFOXYA12_FULL_35_19]|nr:MAG: hypothetical protein UR78_C0018G0018 [Candidatus Moranbacteria bacterium GW2011_GWF2_35_39]OGI31011.1 MAG: hypothetical protein A2343_02000 [Candidatus Moranbacteria bacterium RIFOXYB12_FULL_35_8]OGI32114.1 MAG: hypothetical protein A2489_02040 [Candidatus Moranbacteria bacterium RIFOXYC12_FULL_36_13]OGI35082.1 MAG: hypothetical protein A2271_05080 [Candidatus Moranbacteria bacterium RIFOXYA12_FULL_35_19]
MTGEDKKNNTIEKEIQELVKARLSVMPDNVFISIGANGETYTRDELIEHVNKKDDIGKLIIDIDMGFLRALKEGEIYEQIVFNN